ncbi:MAG: type II toxin-antitoxin system PemK/MazF family toxin [Lactobacillales bacterium]|nr:type II toxin-antitoxin system PemK/MazF family toxin [Lactobacillales bacterium]
MVKRFEVFHYKSGAAMVPALVVSPNELNAFLPYVIIAPITEVVRRYPCRIKVNLKGKKGQIALDMMQCCPKDKLSNKIGILPGESHAEILSVLNKMFAL